MHVFGSFTISQKIHAIMEIQTFISNYRNPNQTITCRCYTSYLLQSDASVDSGAVLTTAGVATSANANTGTGTVATTGTAAAVGDDPVAEVDQEAYVKSKESDYYFEDSAKAGYRAYLDASADGTGAAVVGGYVVLINPQNIMKIHTNYHK